MTNITNYIDIAKMDNYELIQYLLDNFDFQVLPKLETIEEMQEASQLLMFATNANSFLTNVLSYVSLFKRDRKREYESYKKGSQEYASHKHLYEDYVDKEAILMRKIESLDNIKQTTSRMLTIKQEIDKELTMVGDTP